MTGPLHGLTVIDLTRVLSGPYCTMMLADLGARVIKVEHPRTGDDTRAWGPPFVGRESAYFLSINRNKESVALDFKSPEGAAVLARLIAQADVLVENFKPGTLDRAGFGADAVRARHPRLIYASISGYGQTGPRRSEAGYDAVIQAEGGLMSFTGEADGPALRMGVAISDIVAGMFAAQAITAALYHRTQSGEGQRVDIGMLDTTAALLTYQAGNYFATGQAPGRLGNRHPTIAPYETLPTRDGDLVVAVGNDGIWRRFCPAIDRPTLADDPRFLTNRDRLTHYHELRPLLVEALQARTRAEWTTRFHAAGVPCGAVRDLHEVLSDPQIEARDMVASVDHPTVGPTRVMGSPLKLSATPPSVRTPPPLLGQHTRDVLTELGYDQQMIEQLSASGVIRL
ncbi:MAG: CoA transferase [Acidobacteria bacterium]|nr:CoA transferase [Acidobacteriota bacterium]